MREGWARLRHLMRKDWRYIRVWAAAGAVLTATMWPLFAWGGPWFFVSLIHLLAAALPFVALTRLLQLDPVLGSTSFWATRPIDRIHQLASKLLVGFGLVLAPCLVLQVAPLGWRGLDLLPLDYALAFASVALRYAAASGVVLVVAAVTLRLSQAALLAAALVPLVVAVGWAYDRLWPSDVTDQGISFWLVVVPLLLLLQALACLGIVYRTRRVAWAAWTLVIGTAGVLVLGRVWPWNITTFPLNMRPATAAPQNRRDWPIRVAVAKQGWWTIGSRNTRIAKVIARVEGLPAGSALIQRGYRVDRFTPAGDVERRELFEPWEGEFTVGRWAPSPVEAATQCGGRRPEERMEVEVYREPGPATGPSVPRLDGLQGHLQFDVVRAFVVRKAPVHGGSLEFRGHHFEGSVSEAAGGSEVVLRTERLIYPPFSRPRVDVISRRVSFFDPARGDCIVFKGVTPSGSFETGPLVPLEIWWNVLSSWQWMGDPRDPGQPLPRTTEMLLIDYDVLGTLEVPFASSPAATSASRDTLRAAGGG